MAMVFLQPFSGLFITELALSKFYFKKTDDAIGTCSVSSDVETQIS
jgi:hypothetical protein